MNFDLRSIANDRRNSNRLVVDLGATLHQDSVFYAARIVDVSEGGVSITTSCPLAVGTSIALAFPLDGEVVMVRGEVRWSKRGGAGVVFTYMSGFDRAMVLAFCRKRYVSGAYKVG